MSLLLFVSHQLQALQETHLHGRPLLQGIDLLRVPPQQVRLCRQALPRQGAHSWPGFAGSERSALHRCYLSLGKPTVVSLLPLVADGSKQEGRGRATAGADRASQLNQAEGTRTSLVTCTYTPCVTGSVRAETALQPRGRCKESLLSFMNLQAWRCCPSGSCGELAHGGNCCKGVVCPHVGMSGLCIGL